MGLFERCHLVLQRFATNTGLSQPRVFQDHDAVRVSHGKERRVLEVRKEERKNVPETLKSLLKKQ
jgi:hypothetical protein